MLFFVVPHIIVVFSLFRKRCENVDDICRFFFGRVGLVTRSSVVRFLFVQVLLANNKKVV